MASVVVFGLFHSWVTPSKTGVEVDETGVFSVLGEIPMGQSWMK